MAIDLRFYDPPLPMSASQDEKMTAPRVSKSSQEIGPSTLYHEIIIARLTQNIHKGSNIRVLWSYVKTGEKVFEWIDNNMPQDYSWYQGWIGHLPNSEIFKAGKYKVEFFVNEGSAGSGTFEITEAEVPPKPPNLILTSFPTNAEVLINGVSRGFTPLDLNVSEGLTYNIWFKKEGYSTFIAQETVSPGEIQKSHGLLVPVTPEPEPPPPPEPDEKPWWEEILMFDEDGTFHIGPTIVAVEKVQQWLEDNVYGEKASTTAKVIFYTALAALTGAGIYTLLRRFGIIGTQKVIENIPISNKPLTQSFLNKIAVEEARIIGSGEGGTILGREIERQLLQRKAVELVGAQPVWQQVINLKGPVGKWLVLAGSLMGIDLWATWPVTDNIATMVNIDSRNLLKLLQDGEITKEEALNRINIMVEIFNKGKQFVDVSNLINPLVRFLAPSFKLATDAADVLIKQNQKEIQDFPEPPAPPEPPPDNGEPPPEPPPGPVEPGKAWVLFKSNPIGAGIYIDGDYKFIKTPFQFLLSARERPYFIQIAAPTGYRNPTGRTIYVIANVNQTLDFGDLDPLAPGEVAEPFVPVPIEVPIEPIEPPEFKPNAWKYTITARDSETGNIVGAKIIINGIYTEKYTTNTVILEPSATYLLRLEAFGYEPAELTINTEEL